MAVLSAVLGLVLQATTFAAQHYILISLSLLAAYVIRQRYFHPLSSYPGPFLASITNFWRLVDIASGEQHTKDLVRHRRYGSVYRDGPNSLCFADPRALEAIYGHHRELHKSKTYWAFPATTDDRDCNHFMSRFVDQARTLKKMVAPLYDMRNALEYEHRMDTHIDRWCEKLGRMQIVDVAEWTRYIAADIISDIFHGQSLGFIEAGHDINDYMKTMQEMWKTLPLMFAVPWLTKLLKGPILGPFLEFLYPYGTSGISKFVVYAQKLVDERLAYGNPTGRPHFATAIVEQVDKNPDSKHPMTRAVAVGEVLVSLMAGSDSVAAVLVPFIVLLAANRKVYNKVRAEFDAAIANGRINKSSIVEYAEIQESLPLLMASMREATRMHPAFGSTWPRIVPAGGLEILPGTYVPAGTDVGMVAYVANRDKAIFGEDADEFRPERWLTPNTEQRNLMERYECAFGYKYSNRVCSGRNIATIEISKIVAELFRRFDFELEDPNLSLEKHSVDRIQILYSDVRIRFMPLGQKL